MNYLIFLALFTVFSAHSSASDFNIKKALTDVQSWTVFLEAPGLTFEAKSEQSKLVFQPNIAAQLGFEIELPYFSVGVASHFNTSPEFVETKGATKYFHFQYSKYSDNWGLEGYYNRYRSFYIADNGDDTKILAIRPDISVQSFGLRAYLVLDDSFSIKNLFSFSNSPQKSGGSFIFSSVLDSTIWSGDQSIIPSSHQSYFLPASDFLSYSTISIQVAGGYGAVWANDFMYAGISALLGFGYQKQQFKNNTETTDFQKPNSIGGIKLVIASKNNSWNYGLQLHYDSIATQIDDSLNYTTGSYTINLFLAKKL